MATTLRIDSFNAINISKQSELTADVAQNDTSLSLRSTGGLVAGQTIYVGQPSRDGAEAAVIASVASDTAVTLTAGLKLAHRRYDAVTGVVGGSIKIYRAANVDGSVPDESLFSLLATRTINPTATSTYYNDATGSAAYWYRFTYFDPATADETSLLALDAVRGDDVPHYASLSDVRNAAGFQNATNLSDSTVELWRNAAESQINSALASSYVVPFNPVPDEVKSLTIELGAALLLNDSYGDGSYKTRLTDVRARIEAFRTSATVIIDQDGQSLNTGSSISSYPDDSAPRSFTMGQIF